MSENVMSGVMPVLALRGLTVFPNMLMHFDVGRDISNRALEEAMAGSQTIFLVAQKEIDAEYPEEAESDPAQAESRLV